MSKFEASDYTRLLELLNQRLDLFEEICKLCQDQTGLLHEDKLEELDKSLNRTHELREKINGLHQETETLVQSYVSSLNGKKDADIEKLIEKTQETIEKCAKINEKNMKAISELTEGQKKKIDKQRAKREGIGGYTQAVNTSSELIDRKS